MWLILRQRCGRFDAVNRYRLSQETPADRRDCRPPVRVRRGPRLALRLLRIHLRCALMVCTCSELRASRPSHRRRDYNISSVRCLASALISDRASRLVKIDSSMHRAQRKLQLLDRRCQLCLCSTETADCNAIYAPYHLVSVAELCCGVLEQTFHIATIELLNQQRVA